MNKKLSLVVLALIVLASCGTNKTETVSTSSEVSVNTTEAAGTTFTAEVWADNWFSLYINGVLVGEDSVPITTEKSFNSEKISFTAELPFSIAMVTKDFKQDDSGLEYIGSDRQQMGDGGFIAQFTTTQTGEVVAYTNSDWRGLVIHRAPLDKSCEKSAAPETECQSSIASEPEEWSVPSFSDTSWTQALEYSAEAIGVKDGYNDISWAKDAHLIWSSDLEIDNTILWRYSTPSSIQG
jgi:hypothetical protein